MNVDTFDATLLASTTTRPAVLTLALHLAPSVGWAGTHISTIATLLLMMATAVPLLGCASVLFG